MLPLATAHLHAAFLAAATPQLAPCCSGSHCTPPPILTHPPAGNWFVAKAVNASTLIAALNNGLSGWTGNVSAQGRFPQIGGALRAAFDPSLPEAARLVGAELRLTNGSSMPLESYPGDILLLSTDYLTKGGDFYEMLKEQPVLFDSSKPLNEILAEHFQVASPVTAATDGRLLNCAQAADAPLCAGRQLPAPAPAPAASGRALRSWARFAS